jgi:uncharacterized small protein (DUF1192 family)
MRKPVAYALVAATIVLAVTSAILFAKFRQTSDMYTTTKASETEAQTRYGEAISAIAEIQDSLGAVVLGEPGGPLVASDLNAERQLSSTHGHEILDRIALLKAGIERAKGRIQKLEANLKKDGIEIKGMSRMIANLKKSVGEKETMVAGLVAQVDSLQTTVTGLTATVEEKEKTVQEQAVAIEDSRRELGTVFYLIGSKRDLTTAGAVIARGGVLGMGKTLEPSGHMNESLFTTIDTDQQSVIRIPAAKAQVISAQPLASYELTTIGNETELRILDSKAFRKVKHVLIMTAS